ncbi:ribonuclease HII [Thermoproteota archaeon]
MTRGLIPAGVNPVIGGLVTAGVDEAGRGALAGPVVAAAVILTTETESLDLVDSKQLNEKKRDAVFKDLQKATPHIGIGIVSHYKIDKINILNASLLAMKKAVLKLSEKPELVLIDGNRVPQMEDYNLKAVVKGDQTIRAVSAASIAAKVVRDHIMRALHNKYPGYDFIGNKGYATAGHYASIFKNGLSPVHRLSFNLTRQEMLF